MIALTGHTRGLGREINNCLNCTHLFSKSNGYDICNNRQLIVKESIDCNIFINNAFSFNDGFAQTKLLWELHKQEYSGLVINIASSLETVVRKQKREYDIYKKSLIDASKQLYYTNFKSTILAPGAIDIGMGKNCNTNKLKVLDVIEALELIIKLDGSVQQIIMTGRFK